MNVFLLENVISDQREKFLNKPKGIKRDIDYSKFFNDNRIVVITGIRRCGKSTLLTRIIHAKAKCIV